MSQSDDPKVFISYSWSHEDHVDWVIELAKRLVSDGVDVIIDRWNLKPGQDKYDFMEQMVKDRTVTKVLIICDRIYAQKADNRAGGVGDETQIISPETYGSVSQSKFIPVIAEKNEHGQAYKPIYLKARIHIDLSDPTTYFENYEDLLRDIYGKPLHSKPPLGQRPAFLQDDTKPKLPTSHKLQTFKAALLANKPTMVGMAQDYLQCLNETLEDFDLLRRKNPDQQPATAQQRTFEIAVRDALTDALPLRQEYIEFMLVVCQYGSDQRLIESIGRFFEATLRLLIRTPNNMEPLRLIVPELFIYTCAILIKYERFTETDHLLGRSYFVQDQRDPTGTSADLYQYAAFEPRMPMIESLSQNESLTTGLMKARATDASVTFADVKCVDYVLFLRSVIGGLKQRRHWHPITQSYLEEEYILPLFQRAMSKQFFSKLKIVLGVNSKDDLVHSLNVLCENKQMPKIRAWDDQGCALHRMLMGIDKLDSF